MDCGTPGPIGFSRQEHWSGLPFPRPGDLSSSRDPTRIPCVSCTGTQILYPEPPGSPKECRDLGTARNLNGISLCSVLIFPVLFWRHFKNRRSEKLFQIHCRIKGKIQRFRTFLPTIRMASPASNIPNQRGTWATADEPTLTHHDSSQPIIYIVVHA